MSSAPLSENAANFVYLVQILPGFSPLACRRRYYSVVGTVDDEDDEDGTFRSPLIDKYEAEIAAGLSQSGYSYPSTMGEIAPKEPANLGANGNPVQWSDEEVQLLSKYRGQNKDWEEIFEVSLRLSSYQRAKCHLRRYP